MNTFGSFSKSLQSVPSGPGPFVPIIQLALTADGITLSHRDHKVAAFPRARAGFISSRGPGVAKGARRSTPVRRHLG
jgi:hypothetical protein